MQSTVTPEVISYIAAAAAGLGLIVRELQRRNGNGNHDDRIRRMIAEHERNCIWAAEMRDEIRSLRSEMNHGFDKTQERLDKLYSGSRQS